MANVLIMASDGFEQSELLVPRDRLVAAGHRVEIAAPRQGEIRAWDKDDWGCRVTAGQAIGDVVVEEWDALVLPGGVINPDNLRQNPKAVALVQRFVDAGKPVAAICHAPWLLIEAGLVRGRRMTGYASIRTDLRNAGAEVVDAPVVEDRGVITSRNPGDLEPFSRAVLEALA